MRKTAIHNHMVGERPRAFIVDFWANDDAIEVANGLHAALKTVVVAPRRRDDPSHSRAPQRVHNAVLTSS